MLGMKPAGVAGLGPGSQVLSFLATCVTQWAGGRGQWAGGQRRGALWWVNQQVEQVTLGLLFALGRDPASANSSHVMCLLSLPLSRDPQLSASSSGRGLPVQACVAPSLWPPSALLQSRGPLPVEGHHEGSITLRSCRKPGAAGSSSPKASVWPWVTSVPSPSRWP